MKNNGDIIPFIKQKNYVMINNQLGGGSFGKTVLLQDPVIDELFVAKKYEPEFEEIKEKFYKNFQDEIKILYKLNHRNVVRIYNYYTYDEGCIGYIIMEYIDGKNIGEFIEDYSENAKNVSIDEIFIQLIDAFCYIESLGIVHRDIREGNILIDNDGTVKVIDFGIGKIFEAIDSSDDSLVSQVNRDNSDTLPREYYEGIYTSKTDMFYLAELLNRLIRNADNSEYLNFSYQKIIDKMMQKEPSNRYESFISIKDEIGRHDFSNMNISEKDKKIYQSFTSLVFASLDRFIDERKFNTDISIFVSRLEKALRDNSFEDIIQKNSDIIGSIVIGKYQYNSRINIPCHVVKEFLDWFKESNLQSKELILNNIIAKLSIVRIEESEPDYPF
ncbi:MAG: protein kinase [Oscillospiraceae bacterium]|nr:protein kinase [Oscillospiraceae bacterium]